MGLLFTKPPTKSVLVVGLDGSGKSALLSCARGIFRDDLTGSLPGVVRSELIDPTAGMRLEIFTSGTAEWRCWDMSGRGTSRSMWPHFFSYVDAIVFVIDCTDIARAAVVREELNRIVQQEEVQRKNVPFLFILNKIDIQKDEDEELVQKVRHWPGCGELPLLQAPPLPFTVVRLERCCSLPRLTFLFIHIIFVNDSHNS